MRALGDHARAPQFALMALQICAPLYVCGFSSMRVALILHGAHLFMFNNDTWRGDLFFSWGEIKLGEFTLTLLLCFSFV
jgi:hypothetical protein